MALADKFEDMAADTTVIDTEVSKGTQESVREPSPTAYAEQPANAVAPIQQHAASSSLKHLENLLDIRSVTSGMTASACIAGKILVGDGKIGTWCEFKPLTYSYEWVVQADRESKSEETLRLEKRGPTETTAYDGTSLQEHLDHLKNTLGHTKASIQKRIKIVAMLISAEVPPKDFEPGSPFMFFFSLPLTSSNQWDRMINRLALNDMVGMGKPMRAIKAYVEDFKAKGRDYTALSFKELY